LTTRERDRTLRRVENLRAPRKRLWRIAALVAGVGSAVGASAQLLVTIGFVEALPPLFVVGTIVTSSIVAAVVSALIVETLVARRLRALSRFVDEADAGDFLLRIPVKGHGELAEANEALNRLLARITSLRGSMIDQTRELERTREQLRLEETLARKTTELEAQLAERKLVFDLLRISVTENELDKVLREMVTRIGTGLRLRESAIFLRASDGSRRYIVRAVHGFQSPQRVLGRLVEAGLGIAGEVARTGEPVVLRDVSNAQDYLAFWGEAAREGAFGAFPISLQGSLLGILGVTRDASDPLTDEHLRLLGAIADQAALAIRHAQVVDELRALSTTDELTQLANRRALGRQLDREIERSQRFGNCVSVVAIDIDFFKKLNDTCGHPTGDAALCAVAENLLATVRRIDTVARTGGEEFLVVLPRTTLDEAMLVAEKLRAQIADHEIPGGATQPAGHLTISLGVAELLPGEDSQSLLARADEALYAAKRHGRDRVECHDGSALSVPVPASA
jgi:diguanylate cyclase (GGDEF)-like protein